MHVFVLPPRLSRSNLVNLLSRYGTWPWCSTKAVITLPNVRRDLLISPASLVLPDSGRIFAPERVTFSDLDGIKTWQHQINICSLSNMASSCTSWSDKFLTLEYIYNLPSKIDKIQLATFNEFLALRRRFLDMNGNSEYWMRPWWLLIQQSFSTAPLARSSL